MFWRVPTDLRKSINGLIPFTSTVLGSDRVEFNDRLI